MTTQNKNVPALRFSEFNGEWNDKKLEDISVFLDGRRKPIKESDRAKIKGIYPYYGASGIIDYVNDYIFDEDIILLGEDGENIISRNLPLAFRVSGKCWINNHAHVIKPNNSTDIDFLTQCLENISYVQYNTGTAQPKLNQEVCRKIPLKLPTLPEQQKIAAFLTAVDEKIQQLAGKKDFLEQYKKGVMQKIFNQEIRFKDDNGNDFADWELKELKEIAFRITAKNKSNEINKVLTNSATQGIVSQQDYFDKDIANPKNLEGYYIVEKDDFVYNPRISTSAPVGPIKRNNLEKGLMSPLYSVFRFNDVNLNFIEQFFQTNLWHDYLKSIANYGARHDRMNITVEGFFEMPILLPTKPEQQKIAAFLSAIDDKINLVNQQLEKTKEYKKGLLQQMFV